MTARLATATPSRLPSFRYSERGQAPSRCGHCGARLLIGDVPTATCPRTDVCCLMCSRTSHELTYDELRAPVTGEQFRAMTPSHQAKRGPKPRPEDMAAARFVRLLEYGIAMPAWEVADRLGVHTRSLSSIGSRARALGHNVICEAGCYRLEGGGKS